MVRGASLIIKRLQNFTTLRCYIFVSFQQITFKLQLANSLILRRSFQWCQRILPNLSMSKIEKKPYRAVFIKALDNDGGDDVWLRTKGSSIHPGALSGF